MVFWVQQMGLHLLKNSRKKTILVAQSAFVLQFHDDNLPGYISFSFFTMTVMRPNYVILRNLGLCLNM